jgi:hypothetical protein
MVNCLYFQQGECVVRLRKPMILSSTDAVYNFFYIVLIDDVFPSQTINQPLLYYFKLFTAIAKDGLRVLRIGAHFER